jgi:TetR/AcrR family transcriptional repressor of nem operon
MVTAKGLETRQRILQVAAELFYRRGYHSVGINDVLEAAEAPKGSFYHYFEGKEEVAREAITYFGERVLGRVSDLLLSPKIKSGPDRLRDFVEAVARQVEDGETVASCPLGSLGMQLAPSLPHLAELADEYLSQLLSKLQEFFEAAEAGGELRGGATPDWLAREFLYLYEGSLVISTVQGKTDAFKGAMENFVGAHFRNG